MTDWIAKSSQPECLVPLTALSEDHRRRVLLQFIERYHATYRFEVLDLPIAFLKVPGGPGPSREKAADHIQEGKYEYCFSLNYLSDALERLLSDDPLQEQDARTVINLVLEAYACNETQSAFLERELTHLGTLVEKRC